MGGFALALVLVAPALGKPGQSSSSVTIAASKNPILVGSSTTITGQATGKKAAGAKVDLQAEAAGSTSFSTVSSTTADTTGHFTFTVAPTVNTTYRATTKTAPSATSPNVLVKVRVKVSLHVSATRPTVGTRVRFSGFVLPAYTGKIVLVQRTTPKGWRTVAQAKLVAASPTGALSRSRYSKGIRFRHSGRYRVRFNPPSAMNLANTSPARRLTW
jgi:hypothetical protein